MRKFCLFALLAMPVAFAASCYNPTFGSPGYFCNPDDAVPCPSGTTCKLSGGDYHCLKSSGGNNNNNTGALEIPKTGSYAGTKQDPELNSASDCTDAPLESNNNLNAATDISASVTINGGGTWINMQAICPKGSSDIDYFLYDSTGSPQSQIYLKAEIQYDIQYGDLDLAIVDAEGSVMTSDGSFKSNGCTVASIGNGKFYVGVLGADGDVNRYQIRVRAYTTPQSCASSGDMK